MKEKKKKSPTKSMAIALRFDCKIEQKQEIRLVALRSFLE